MSQNPFCVAGKVINRMTRRQVQQLQQITRTDCCVLLALALALGAIPSCGGDIELKDYIQTAKSGINVLPWPRQIETLFGDADHFITEYGFSPGPKQWNTEVFFGGRYRLTLQVMVDIDYQHHTIKTNVTPPQIYLCELESLIGDSGANIAHQWVLDEPKWNKLVHAKGDWSVLVIPVKTNNPIPGFERYAAQWRAPRVKIPH